MLSGLQLSSLVRAGFGICWELSTFLGSFVRLRSSLIAENLLLRKQLASYQDHQIRPRRLTDAARISLVLWSKFCDWRSALVIVKPETLTGWHRRLFKQSLAQIESAVALARADLTGYPDATESLSTALVALDGRVSVADNALTQIVANDTALRTQQTAVAQLQVNLQQLQTVAYNDQTKTWITSLDLAVPTSKDGTVSGNVTCVNRLDSTKTTLDPMPYSVAYSVVPRLSLSAGMLFSPIQSRTIGATEQKTGVDSTNTDTVQSVVSLTNGADVQVIPMTFLDFRIGKGWSYRTADQAEMLKHAFMSKHVFTWGISGGLGVNPYNGGPNAEFFAGLFGAIDRFTLHAGADWGRISNVGGGFLIGDVVPSGTTIPTTLHYVTKFGVGLSVRLYP